MSRDGGGAGDPRASSRSCSTRRTSASRSASSSARTSSATCSTSCSASVRSRRCSRTRRSRTSWSTRRRRSTSSAKGRIEETDIVFRDDQHLMQIIERIVSAVGRRIDESTPMVDARLQDGSRVNAIIPPLALDGPVHVDSAFPHRSARRRRPRRPRVADAADARLPARRRRGAAQHHRLGRHRRRQDDAAQHPVELHLATTSASSPSRTRPS